MTVNYGSSGGRVKTPYYGGRGWTVTKVTVTLPGHLWLVSSNQSLPSHYTGQGETWDDINLGILFCMKQYIPQIMISFFSFFCQHF